LAFRNLRAEPQVVEYLLDDSGILDGRYQTHLLLASGAAEDIK